MTSVGALPRVLAAGVLLSLLEVAVAAPPLNRLLLGQGEWWAFAAASLALGLSLSLAASSALVLVSALAAATPRRELVTSGVLAATSASVGVCAFLSLTTGRRLIDSPWRVPLIAGGALAMAFGALALRRILLHARRAGGSWRLAGALLVTALALLAVEQGWLVRLYPALHLLLTLGAVLSALGAVHSTPTWRRPVAWARPVAWLSLALTFAAPPLAAGALVRLSREPNAAYAVTRSAAYTARLLERVPTPAAAVVATPMVEHAGRHGLDLREQPDVLLITVDALRADRLRSYGGVGLTPEMDALADSGMVFMRAYTTTPHTSYALSSLMTGKFLRPLYELGGAAESQPTLAGILRRYGYRTAAFYPPAIFFVDGARFADFRESGFDFEYRKAMFLDARRRPAQLDAWLEQLGPEHPAFAWVHLFEPHEPYEPPEGYAASSAEEDRYDGEVRVADEAVGELIRVFRGHRPGATVILTADHGEEFGDHGGRYHGTTLYEEQIRVPLVWSSPGAVRASTTAAPVELVDVASTLLSALAVPADVRMRGDDLGALLLGDESAGPPWAFADIANERFVTDGRLAAICPALSAHCRLYDLELDPEELRNVAAERAADVERMRAAIAGFAASVPRVEALALGGAGAWPDALSRAALGDASQAPELLRLLGSSRPEVRGSSARALARFAYRPGREPLSRLARADEDPGVRAEAAIAAYSLGELSLAEALAMLLEGAEPSLARRAASALAAQGDARGRELLVALALDAESDETERLGAIQALSHLGGDGVRESLVRLLADVRLRTPAAEALGRLGDRAAIPALREALSMERYLPARGAEARALWTLGDRRVKRDVLRFLGMDVPMPGGVRLLHDLHALVAPRGAYLAEAERARRGGFVCSAQACDVVEQAWLRLPPRVGGQRLVLLARAPEGGGSVRVGDLRQRLPLGDHELSWPVPRDSPRELPVATSSAVQIVAFVVVPTQREIPPPAPEPWRAEDGGLADAATQGSAPAR